jgi:spermidine/putrescine transport system ATP-binding protein
MVFQHYALFPHLDVTGNVAYGLRQRRPRPDREALHRQVEAALELVRLPGYGRRRIWELSGGQQQRVALARALINRPTVLLLDEPLAALDRKLRREMQIELQNLQREVGITFILVTHDQEEALSMSDRIAVMNHGRIEQIGTPADVYEQPATVFVADFLGVSNLMDADAVGAGAVQIGDFTLRAGCGELAVRGPVKVVARPERLALLAHGSQAENCLPGMVERTVYVGATLQVIVRLPAGGTIQASLANSGQTSSYAQGTPVAVHIPVDALRVLAPSARPPASAGEPAHEPARELAAQS